MKKKILPTVLLISLSIRVAKLDECDLPQVKVLCEKKDLQCYSCLELHYCCNWCYDKAFSENRCGTNKSLTSNNCKNMEPNSNSVMKEVIEKDFSSDVQIKQQRFKINLRKGEPLNLTFEYKPDKNFPLNLYYLMDVSFSMKDKLDNVIKLGEKLPDDLTKLSKNTTLALGFFMDKTVMPFYRTSPASYQNPCYNTDIEKCDPGFLFKHAVNFTDKYNNFLEKLEDVSYTANLDNLDGASIALMQILNCEEKFNWLPTARKQILLLTDSEMHFAGDGLLSGSIKRHPNKCLSDEILNSNLYDYPSLEELHEQLRQKKTHLIIASSPGSFKYYKELNKTLETSSFLGEMRGTQTDEILEVTKQGFKNFAKRVSFNVQPKDYLSIEFFTNCGDGKKQKRNWCDNIEMGVPVEFEMQIKLIGNVPFGMTNETIEITEKSVSDVVNIDVDYFEHCKCSSYELKECKRGQLECGSCRCEADWTGSNCNERCEDISKCRDPTRLDVSCSGNGECVCGKCKCDYGYSGEFCQYNCPVGRFGTICSGHGSCINETCICNKNYEGELCSCSTLTDNCKFGDVLCFGEGECVCNECKCNQNFTGEYCQYKKDENLDMSCSVLDKIVLEIVQHSGNLSSYYKVHKLDYGAKSNYLCVLKYEKDKEQCLVKYSYEKSKSHLVLYVEKESCQNLLQASIKMGGIIVGAIFLLGLMILSSWKVYQSEQDKREYKRLQKEVEKHKGIRMENPLYVNPWKKYDNILGGSSKFD